MKNSQGKICLRLTPCPAPGGYTTARPSPPPPAARPSALLAQAGAFPALSPAAPLVRYLPPPGSHGAPVRPRSGPLRLLVVRAAPRDLPALDLEGELKRILAQRRDLQIEVLDHP